MLAGVLTSQNQSQDIDKLKSRLRKNEVGREFLGVAYRDVSYFGNVQIAVEVYGDTKLCAEFAFEFKKLLLSAKH